MCGEAPCVVSQLKRLPRRVFGSSTLPSVLVPLSRELLGRSALPWGSTSLVAHSCRRMSAGSWCVGCDQRVPRTEEVRVAAAPSQWDAWVARCLDSSTQRLQRSHTYNVTSARWWSACSKAWSQQARFTTSTASTAWGPTEAAMCAWSRGVC